MISYSLYLWHWPALLGARYFDIVLTPLHTIFLFATSVFLATASYLWIETPFRHAKKTADKKFILASLGGVATMALASYMVFVMDGFPFRVPENVQAAERVIDDKNPRQVACLSNETSSLPPCKFGASGLPSAILWGDFHADFCFHGVG